MPLSEAKERCLQLDKEVVRRYPSLKFSEIAAIRQSTDEAWKDINKRLKIDREAELERARKAYDAAARANVATWGDKRKSTPPAAAAVDEAVGDLW